MLKQTLAAAILTGIFYIEELHCGLIQFLSVINIALSFCELYKLLPTSQGLAIILIDVKTVGLL